MKIPKQKLKTIIEEMRNNKAKRLYYCEKSLELFMIYYMTKYLKHKFAPFHRLMFKLLEFESFQFLIFVMFRGSAKTTFARAKVLHAICYNYKKNIKWIGFDDKKAKKNISSISRELQGNKKIIEDFGQLFFEDRKKGKVSKSKTIKEFQTTNGVFVSTGSVKVSTRGDLDDENRPDFYVIDDIENEETKSSPVKTNAVKVFLGELFTGDSPDCNYLILGNYITKIGTIQDLLDKAKDNKNWRKLFLPLIKNNEIVWKSRWVMTDKERDEINNNTQDKKSWVSSFESKVADVGKATASQEYLLKPKGNSDLFKSEYWKFFAISDLEDKNSLVKKSDLRVGIITDPATSTRDKSDFFVCLALAFHPILKRFYILDIKADKYAPSVAQNIPIDMAEKWRKADYNIDFISVEDVAINTKQRQLVNDIQDRMTEREVYFPFRRWNSSMAKEDRIRYNIEPAMSRGELFFRCDDLSNPAWGFLDDQLLKFPLAENDDIPDTIAQGIMQFLGKGNGKKAEQSETDNYWGGGAKNKRTGTETGGVIVDQNNIPLSNNMAAQSSVDDYWED